MTNAELQILINARDNASQALGSIASGIQKHSKAIGLTMTALGGTSILAARSFVNAALVQEQAEKTLAITVEKTGQSWDAVRGKILSTTAALQAKTNYGDEEQLAILTKMIPILGSEEKALAALPAVLDAATASGMDANSVANTLTRALAGQVNQARSVGIEFDKDAEFGERLSLVLSKVGGAAAANANPMTQLSNTLGDVKEVMGAALLPTIKILAEKVGALAVTIMGWIDRNQGLLKILGPVALAIAGILTVLGPLLIMLPGIIAIAPAVGVAFTIMTGPVGLVIAAIAGLIAIGVLLWKNWDTVKEKAGQLWEFLKAGFDTFLDYLKEWGPKIVSLLAAPMVLGFRGILEAVESILSGISKIPVIGGKVSGALEGVRGLQAMMDQYTFAGMIPGLQHGGIVTRPTLAMIGERGPEAVVPLGAVGGTLNVNLGGGILVLQNEMQMRQFARVLHGELRTQNRRGIGL